MSVSVSAMILSFYIHSPWSEPNIYSDIMSFWGRSWLVEGKIPIIQEFFEYPPICGFLIYISRYLGVTQDGYYTVFGIMTIACSGVMAWSCWRISRALDTKLNAFYFLLPSMIIYGVYSFDLFHAMFIALSLQAYLEARRSTSAVMLSLAILTKLVSAVLIPVFLLDMKTLRSSLKYLAFMAGTAIVITLPIVILNPSYFYQFYLYFKTWGLEDAWFVWIFPNQASWGYAKIFGLGIMGLLLIWTYALKIPLVPKLFLALVAFLLGTYLYAPQFNLMLIPLIAVLSLESPSLFFWELFNALIILTWFLVPTPPGPTAAGTVPQIMSLLRAAMLAWMGASVAANYGVKPFAKWKADSQKLLKSAWNSALKPSSTLQNEAKSA